MNRDESKLLIGLNPAQKQAVTTDIQHTIVLAGAGSGKTRVLVHRIAWLCKELYYPISSIFAVTFTNKSAHEMTERIRQIIGTEYSHNMWVGTFHGLSHRLLRIFHKQANLPPNFQLIDTDDQKRIVRKIFRDRLIDEKTWSYNACSQFISAQKEQGIRPEYVELVDPQTKLFQKVYLDYQAICNQLGYVDFSELLLKSYELLKDNAEVNQYCRDRFKNVLVDEFQDTNHIQYHFIKLLAGDSANVMIVGDDDQSIYGWRGANSDNLQQFIDDYKETDVIKLEQNYRSTKPILDSANHLISHNKNRLGKELWTKEEQGDAIHLYSAFNDIDEARYVISQIKQLHDYGENFSDCAILYRNNVQARILEDTILQNNLPYRIYGAIRFYERQEVKLALAYLRFIHDKNNDIAFEQIINTPTRGIGYSALEKVRWHANQQNQTLWIGLLSLFETNTLTARQRSSFARFFELMSIMAETIENKPLHEQLEIVIKSSGLYTMYEQEIGIKGQSRLENLDELISGAEQFNQIYSSSNLLQEQFASSDGAPVNVLELFLSYTSLEGKEFADNKNCIQLMTLHSAKGLEFDHVFIVGWEDGLFPAMRSISEPTQLEEERRLAYVGLTRARKSVYISFCSTRKLYGKTERFLPSRFLSELPVHHIQAQNIDANWLAKQSHSSTHINNLTDQNINRAKNRPLVNPKNSDGLDLGCKVIHDRFGEGTIINTEGDNDHRRVQIAFENAGIKWIVVKLAKLTIKK